MTESTRTPPRSALLWILLATTCCLAGWILGDLTRADAAPTPPARIALATQEASASSPRVAPAFIA
ncbi:hypothetical protein MHY85_02655, partial [Cellulomonas sp. ACRRI]|uniref:hypothetical protein n=1 Tax=Cellulomonas sp. ACRRI TaxID=2918188 RepID=UPI001EF31E66